MAQGIQSWSTTAADNGNADANINYVEGSGFKMPAINNSGRAVMSALAAFYDAIGGGCTYGGSSNAYTVTQPAVGAWSAYAEGLIIGLEANHTNNGAATVNVDGLGAKSIVKSANTAVASGDIVSGAFYLLRYDGTNFQIVGGAAATFQPLDATLTALAALSYTSGTLIPTLTAADTFALVDAATFVRTTGDQSIGGSKTFTGGVVHSATSPDVRHRETDAATNEQYWWDHTNGGIRTWYLVNDAFDASNALFEIDRTAHTAAIWNFGSIVTLRHNGSAIRVAGKTAVPVPASAMVARSSNGAAAGTTETSSNKIMLRSLDFDASSDEFAQFIIPRMPKSWNESTITARFIWTASNTGNVVWGIQAVAISDDDALDAAFGTAQTVTDGVTAAGDVMHSDETSAVTIGGTPAEGDMVVFQVYRDADNGSDTCAVDAKLIGVELFITRNAANDA